MQSRLIGTKIQARKNNQPRKNQSTAQPQHQTIQKMRVLLIATRSRVLHLEESSDFVGPRSGSGLAPAPQLVEHPTMVERWPRHVTSFLCGATSRPSS